MKWAAVMVLVAGCRFGFQAQTGADDDASVSDDAPPTPTCTGHDEDGDGFPDACDVCPSVADPGQRDRGEILAGNAADGVGDACDPRPSLSGDYIMVFDAHTGPSTTYYQLNSDAMFVGDALRLGTLTTSGQGDFMLPATPSRIATHVHLLATQTSNLSWFGIWYEQNLADTKKAFAEASYDPTAGAPMQAYDLKETSGGMSRYSAKNYGAATFANGDQLDLVVDTSLTTGGDDLFRVIDPQGNEHVQTLSILIPRDVYGFLEAQVTQVDFAYLIAYGIR